MGCDIHCWAENRENGRWVLHPGERDELGSLVDFYDDRNYVVFAALAGVRNDWGLRPIAEPRGAPPDATAAYRREVWRAGADGHSHSWLTLGELLAYDWSQLVELEGTISGGAYARWVAAGRSGGPPTERGDWYVGQGEVLPAAKVDALLARKPRADLARVFTHVTWKEPLHDVGEAFAIYALHRLHRLGPPDDVRLVFFFDN